MIYFTSDLHLGHDNIIKHCNRPFNAVWDMNAAIIDNINARVRKNDTLYILGDFCWGGIEEATDYRNRIYCDNVFLIRGNHDSRFVDNLFSRVYDIRKVKVLRGEQPVVLCHYAMRVWDDSHHGSWHLYGHSHNSLTEDECSLSFDCGVDGNDFHPYSEHEVALRMQPKIEAIRKIINAPNVFWLGGTIGDK